MAVSNEMFELCVNNLIVWCLEILQQKYPQKEKETLIQWFNSSNVCEKLWDRKTGLWTQGPDYLLSLFSKEKNIEI